MAKKIFQSSSTADGPPGYREKTGQTVEVVRQLTDEECDPVNQPMFKIRFEDGIETDAFGCELLETK